MMHYILLKNVIFRGCAAKTWKYIVQHIAATCTIRALLITNYQVRRVQSVLFMRNLLFLKEHLAMESSEISEKKTEL